MSFIPKANDKKLFEAILNVGKEKPVVENQEDHEEKYFEHISNHHQADTAHEFLSQVPGVHQHVLDGVRKVADDHLALAKHHHSKIDYHPDGPDFDSEYQDSKGVHWEGIRDYANDRAHD